MRWMMIIVLIVLLIGCGKETPSEEVQQEVSYNGLWDIEPVPEKQKTVPDTPVVAQQEEGPDLNSLINDAFCAKLLTSKVESALQRVKPYDELFMKSAYYPDLVPSPQAVCNWNIPNRVSCPKYTDEQFRGGQCAHPALKVIFDCTIGKLGGPTAIEFVESYGMRAGQETIKVGDKASFQQTSGHAYIAKQGCFIQLSVPQGQKWSDAQLSAAKEALLAIAPIIDANFP